ncbi:MAG: hypothetical protein ACPGUC_09440 [Gammaproteobacteria bacterium]
MRPAERGRATGVAIGLGVAVLVGWCFWLAVAVLASPEPGGTDAFIFKDAACNLAQGHGFRASAIPGNPGAVRELYSAYSPLHPLIFGAAFMATGCTPLVNTVIELGIATLAVLVVLLALRLHHWVAAGGRWRLFLGVVLAVLVGLNLPTGLQTNPMDRPDNMALIGFVLALWLARRHAGAGGFVAGIVAWVHPFGALMSAFGVWLVAVCVPALQGGHAGVKALALRTLVMILFFLLPVFALVALALLLDPGALPRFLSHAVGVNSGLRAVSGGRSFADLLDFGLLNAGYHSISLGVRHVAAVLAVGVSALLAKRAGVSTRSIVVWHMALVVFLLWPVLLFSSQNAYWTLAGTAVLLLFVSAPPDMRAPGVAAGLLVIILVALTPPSVFRIWTRISYADSFSAVDEAARAYFRDLPDTDWVAVPPALHTLAKQYHHRIAYPGYAASDAIRFTGRMECAYGMPSGSRPWFGGGGRHGR